ncbi:MAG: ABC transporter ATP-binding protein [Phycisphaerales bacterium]|nr:ABC transporter ATP-binding protein [Phycisphaerales bacterium]
MSGIKVRHLVKVYRVHEKPHGLRASVRSLFRRTYKQVRAVDGISFDIEPGEMVGFLGPNGAGKTTTLKILSGLIYPTTGTAEVLGFVPWQRRNAYRRQFSLLMGQKNQLWWDLPASESFRLHQAIYGIEERQFARVCGELTALLKVTDLVNQPVRELSLGERMKMELIAALLHSPRVLFLDEPTIGLDVVAQSNIRRCLRDYNRDNQVTIVLTSHYMRDIEALCDRVLVINHGRLIHDGPLSDIVSRFATSKLLTLRFLDGVWPAGLESFGEVVTANPPMVTLRVPREAIARTTAQFLQEFDVADINVEEPPIEEVIGQMFAASPAPHNETRDA